MNKFAIILAGGEGSRAKSELPKQFIPIDGQMMILWSVKTFLDVDPSTELIVVIHPRYIDEWDNLTTGWDKELLSKITLASGGHSRWQSVKNGLSVISYPEDALIAIHDAARPLVTRAMIERGWDTAATYGSAIPVIPATDSLRHLLNDGNSESVERKQYVAVQTPQIFRASMITKAYSNPEKTTFTDDASVVEDMGENVALYEGDPRNIKVTNPDDFDIATLLLCTRNNHH